MARIWRGRREIRVTFSEQPESKDAKVAAFNDEAWADLPADCQTGVTRFRIVQVWCNGTDPAEEGGIGRKKWCKRRIRRPVREKRENRWVRGCGRQQIYSVKIERVEGNV